MNNRSHLRTPMPRKIIRSLGILAAVLFISAPAFAKEGSVGSVVRVVKDVQITNDEGDERIAKRRTDIFPGDRITTGDEGWLTVNFFDLTRVVLRPNTEFIVKEFPQTMDSGDIELEFVEGGARVTSGTIANQASDRFKVVTPHGHVEGARSEWVIRSCENNECKDVLTSLEKCSVYVNPVIEDRQFISAYEDDVEASFCPINVTLAAGTTLVFDTEAKICKVIDEVPCFILLDGKMGMDKARKLLPKLTYTEEGRPERPERPNSRDIPRRPRIDRPQRRR